MLPPGEAKRPNEYDHASGCPRAPKRAALAIKEPPTVYVDPDGAGGAAYVKLPLPPEVVAAAREHVDNAARLYGMIKSGGAVSVADLLSHLSKSSAAVERDVAKLRKR